MRNKSETIVMDLLSNFSPNQRPPEHCYERQYILLSLVVFVVYVVFIECIVLVITVVLVVLRLLDESLPGSH